MFTVILPVFNRERTIAKAIGSVLNQSFKDYELIIINDCSTDRTVNAISQFVDERIRVYQLKSNSGPAVARNFGIQRSKGKYISFLDSDDFYEPFFLQESNKILNEAPDKVGFIWTGLRFLNKDSVNEGVWIPEQKENSYITFLHSLKIGTNSGITVKKSVFDKCGLFNEKLHAAEDTDFFLRIAQEFDYTYSDKILINVERSNQQRLSKNFEKIAESYNIFIKDHFPMINERKILQKKYYYKLMWLNYHLNNKPLARKYFKKLLKGRIFYYKSLIVFLLFEVLGHKLGKKIHLMFGH